MRRENFWVYIRELLGFECIKRQNHILLKNKNSSIPQLEDMNL